MCLQYKSFENPVRKEEIASDEQFLLFPQYFLPFRRTFSHLNQILNWHLETLSVWTSLKFVVWERVNYQTTLLILPDGTYNLTSYSEPINSCTVHLSTASSDT